MKRRSFLKGLCVTPAIGLTPVFGFEFSNDTFLAHKIPNNSGLDKIIDIIKEDKRLNKKVSQSDIEEAINSAKRMNEIILNAIIETGVANNRKISTADARELNDYIFHNHHEEWIRLHGDDKENEETGFHKVVNDGARTKLFGKNAINKIFNSVYHLGFETHLKNRLLNEDGNKNARYKNVAIWLNSLLKENLESGSLSNPNIKEIVAQTETGLDIIVEIIYNDEGLKRRISTGDMRVGANSANEMNRLIIESIEATNAGDSGVFTTENTKAMNRFLVENYSAKWAVLHGDDEDNEETGYNKVQKNGAKTELFEKNAINRVFDGIYHLGFATPYEKQLVNEDGAKNVKFKKIAQWLTDIMQDNLDNKKEDLKILIPLYIYPDESWQNLIEIQKRHTNVEITAIINPSKHGHFREKDSNYAKGIQNLISANIKVIGYVYTKYAKRETQEIIDDIEAWSQIYKDDGVSGIFFDETANSSSDLEYYQNLSEETKAKGLNFIVLNPGITTDQRYINSAIADVVVSYENPHEKLLNNPPSSYNTPTTKTELSLLIYKMKENNIDDLIAFAREHKFSYIYLTEDGFDGNPWDSISIYFEEQVSKVMV